MSFSLCPPQLQSAERAAVKTKGIRQKDRLHNLLQIILVAFKYFRLSILEKVNIISKCTQCVTVDVMASIAVLHLKTPGHQLAVLINMF